MADASVSIGVILLLIFHRTATAEDSADTETGDQVEIESGNSVNPETKIDLDNTEIPESNPTIIDGENSNREENTN